MPTNRHRRRTSIVINNNQEDSVENNNNNQQRDGGMMRSSSASSNNNSRANSKNRQQSSTTTDLRRSVTTTTASGGHYQQQQQHQTSKIDMTHQNSDRQVVFGLYPKHVSESSGYQYDDGMMTLGSNGDENNNNIDSSNNNNNSKKVFYQQPNGRFTDANGEQKNRQQRIAAQHQFDALRAQVPVWSADDDAKTFAPFFLYLVFAITHVRRMITGAAAGFSILILIAIYWADNLNGVSVDANTGILLTNATIGGAYDTLCLPENQDQCSAIVAYAAVYRPASYFFLLASLWCTFSSLVPFVFDLALMRQRSTTDNIQQMQELQGVNKSHNNNNSNDNHHNNNNNAGIAQTTGTTLPTFGSSNNDSSSPGGGKNAGNNNPDPNSANMLQSQSSIAPYVYMVVRHLVASTFPLFVIALISCMVTAVVEVDRRQSGRMVSIDSTQQESVRNALILRSICYVIAWVGSFRFREPMATDEVLNANAVIDVRQ